MNIKIGISTCPNDMFVFAGLINKKIDCEYNLTWFYKDIEQLNQSALNNELDIVKVSYGIIDKLIKYDYKILTSGGALVNGSGPLFIINNKTKDLDEVLKSNLPIAVPGFNTTAFKLFKIFYPDLVSKCREYRFNEIIPSVDSGECSAGVIIHEGRFIYDKRYNLKKVDDLGNRWYSEFNEPLPLGAIVIKKSVLDKTNNINTYIKKSIEYAYNNKESIIPFLKKYADFMDEKVMLEHIALYVNQFTMDLTPAKSGIMRLAGVTIDKDMFIY